MRTVICVFQVVLYTQRRDRLRFGAAVVLVPVKLALLAVLVWLGLGAVAAATATTVADAILLAIFAGALYWKRKPVATGFSTNRATVPIWYSVCR